MHPTRKVLAATTLDQESHGHGFRSASLRALRVPLDPFLNADDFHMSQPFFPPHPHAGFSAVTWMFPDSEGAFVNRDSLGDRSLIAPGSLHWTLAGAGMMHEEVPERPGTDTHGLQLFVNLPHAAKLTTPRALHVDADRVPIDEPLDGVALRVLVGRSRDVAALIAPEPPITMLDVRLAPNARYTFDAAPDETVVGIGWDGNGTAGDGAAFGQARALVFAREVGPAEFRAGPAGLRFLLLAGLPLGERVVFDGPFAMASEDQAADARRRYHAGEMGSLAPSFTRRDRPR